MTKIKHMITRVPQVRKIYNRDEIQDALHLTDKQMESKLGYASTFTAIAIINAITKNKIVLTDELLDLLTEDETDVP